MNQKRRLLTLFLKSESLYAKKHMSNVTPNKCYVTVSNLQFMYSYCIVNLMIHQYNMMQLSIHKHIEFRRFISFPYPEFNLFMQTSLVTVLKSKCTFINRVTLIQYIFMPIFSNWNSLLKKNSRNCSTKHDQVCMTYQLQIVFFSKWATRNLYEINIVKSLKHYRCDLQSIINWNIFNVKIT